MGAVEITGIWAGVRRVGVGLWLGVMGLGVGGRCSIRWHKWKGDCGQYIWMGNAFWRLGHGNDCDDGYIPGYGGLWGLACSRH